MKAKIVLSLVILLSFGLLVNPAWGEEKENFGLATYGRSKIFIPVASGEKYEGVFRVKNTADKPQELTVFLKDWNLDENGKERWFKPEELPRSLAKYITVYPTKFIVKEGETGKVHYSIELPENEKGCHWIILFVGGSIPTVSYQELPKEVQAKTGKKRIKFVMMPGAILKIFQIDPSSAVEEGRITDVDILQSKETPLTVQFEFTNSGTVPIQTEMNEVNEITGKERIVSRIEFREKKTGDSVDIVPIPSFFTFPYGGKRIVKMEYKGNKLEKGESYQAFVAVGFGGEKLVVGIREFVYLGGELK